MVTLDLHTWLYSLSLDTIKIRLVNFFGKPPYLIRVDGLDDVIRGHEETNGRLKQIEEAFESSDKGGAAVLDMLMGIRNLSYEISEIVIAALTDDGEEDGPKIIH
jgi:hypothetical protein